MQNLHGVKILLSPAQQRARLVFAAFWAIGAHHYGNQATLAIDRRSDQIEPGAGGVAGFQAIDMHGFFPQQAVTVLLGNAVPRQALFAVHVVELGLAVNDGA